MAQKEIPQTALRSYFNKKVHVEDTVTCRLCNHTTYSTLHVKMHYKINKKKEKYGDLKGYKCKIFQINYS
jgi:hypothetical protein